MNIEFTLEDYFNELQSMEKYYGQEEELYPWIYMLLQMVEIRKKNILKEDYNNLCIIDVHNAQHAKGDYDLKKLMQGHVTDFAIVDPNSDSVCGCVEIKKITPKDFELKENIFKMDTIKYKFKFSFEKGNSTTDGNKAYALSSDDYKKLEDWINKNIVSKEISIDLNPMYCEKHPDLITLNRVSNSTIPNRNAYYIDIKIPKENNCLTKLLHASKEITPESPIFQDKPNLKIKITRNPIISELDKVNSQLAWHLINFKKILYTNGLVFYYICDVANDIHVKKIADLTKYYRKTCESHILPPSDRLSAICEWDKLIAALASIDWLHEPITKID